MSDSEVRQAIREGFREALGRGKTDQQRAIREGMQAALTGYNARRGNRPELTEQKLLALNQRLCNLEIGGLEWQLGQLRRISPNDPRLPRIEREVAELRRLAVAAAAAARESQPYLKRITENPVITRAIDDTGRTASFVASTSRKDRHGTRIIPSGIKTQAFDRNPIFAFQHLAYGGQGDPDVIIGQIVRHWLSGNEFRVTAKFDPPEINPTAEKAFQKVKAGTLRAVSVGFIPVEWHEERESDGPTVVFDEIELLEVSLVSVPSNPDALRIS